MSDLARTLLAQHAETVRLLGVDFIPLGRAARGVPDPEPRAGDPAPASGASAPARAFAPRPSAAAEPEAPPRPAPVVSGASDAVRACHEHLSDPQAKLDAVRERYLADAPHRHFVTSFTHVVFGEGDPMARLMFVGEAPGETEDETGRPFVGRAGQLLDKMIVAMGLARERVYICNVLKTRPPNNATPTTEEARLCAPYLIEQVRIVNPEVIVTLGLPATHLLLGTAAPMRELRGRWWSFPPGRNGEGSGFMDASIMGDPDLPTIPVMPTYHPAYLLRSYTEDNRRKVWSDLKQVMDRLSEKSPV